MINQLHEFLSNWYKGEDVFPLHRPIFNEADKEYLSNCIDSTFVSSVGEYVTSFENRIKDYTLAAGAVATTNGTSALQVSLKLAGVRANDLVLMPSISFVASCNAIHYLGASPCFIDIEPKALGLSPEALEVFLNKNTKRVGEDLVHIESGKRISACLHVHIFGLIGEIFKVKEVCQKFHLPLVEDAAEALGSFVNGKHAGTIGTSGCLSFNGNKIITSGGGGIVLTSSQEMAVEAKHITTTAKVPHPFEYDHDVIGYNFRLPNINAALACSQLDKLENILKDKKELYYKYNEFLADFNIELLKPRENTQSNHWLNSFRVSNKDEKNQFLKECIERKIFARPLWKPLHKLSPYADCPKGKLEESEKAYNTIICLPSSSRLNIC